MPQLTAELDASKALGRIARMIPRTAANGATDSEVDAAARQIGRLIMAFPELLTGSLKPQTEHRTASDAVTIDHSGILRETVRAVLFVIRGEHIWLPKSQLKGFNQNSVRMSSWIASEKGFT